MKVTTSKKDKALFAATTKIMLGDGDKAIL
jgi:hypothetical protein